jgi:hypothetical protein
LLLKDKKRTILEKIEEKKGIVKESRRQIKSKKDVLGVPKKDFDMARNRLEKT